MSRAFKITLPGVAAAIIVFASTLSVAEKHARGLVAGEHETEVRPLTEAEYKTVDFKAETFNRVAGGKDDAVVTPFALTFNGTTTYKLASSLTNAEKYLMSEVDRLTGAKVEPVPVEEYATIDWSQVETLADKEPEKEGGKAKEKTDGTETDGDAGKQTDLTDIPGMA